MSAEEKILAYLDGSLSENESAELLHQLSVSPEKRVVLEQHIKLAELTRLAQKPVEVPSELEAMLAKRLPIAPATERLAPVAVRQGSGILTSALLLLRQYPVRFALGGLALLLSTYGVYSLSNKNATTQSPVAEVAQPTHTISGNSQSASSVSTTSPNTIVSSKTTAGTAGSSNTTSSAASSIARVTSLPAASDLKNNQSTTTATSSQRSIRNIANGSRNNSVKEHRAINEQRMHHSIADNLSTNTDNNTAIAATATTDQSSGNLSSSTATSSLGEIPTAVVVSKPIAAISHAEIGERYRPNPMAMNNFGERSPWTVRVSLGMLETFLNVPSGKDAYTARTEGSPYPSVGVNYSVSPSFAFGALLGYSSILTVSPQTATTNEDGVNHVVAHTYSVNSREFFARAAARYSFQLAENLTAETSVEGGMLINSGSPMVAGQFLASHSLNDAFDIQFAALFSGVWTVPAAIQTGALDPADTNPIVYKTESLPGNSKIFSPAFTLRVGGQYHF